jgi:hypothetical protein
MWTVMSGDFGRSGEMRVKTEIGLVGGRHG